MKTRFPAVLCAVIAGWAAGAVAQTSEPAPTVPPTPVAEIEFKFRIFSISANAAERIGLTGTLDAPESRWRGALSPPDFEKLWKLLSAEKSMGLLSSPRVLANSGQQAIIEVSSGFRYPTESDPAQVPPKHGQSVAPIAPTAPGGSASEPAVRDEKKVTLNQAPSASGARNTGFLLEIEPGLAPGGLIDVTALWTNIEFAGFMGYEGGKTQKSKPAPAPGSTQPIFDAMKIPISATLRPGQTLLIGGFPQPGLAGANPNLLQDPSLPGPEESKATSDFVFIALTANLFRPDPPPAPVPDSPTLTPASPNPPKPNGNADAQKWPSAIPVPGKPGFVKSPYAPDAGYVDVRGFPRGTEVKCPYTGKMFLTP